MENGERSGAREGGAKREIRVDLAERMMFTVLMVIVSGTSNFHDAIALVLYDVIAFLPQQQSNSAHGLPRCIRSRRRGRVVMLALHAVS